MFVETLRKSLKYLLVGNIPNYTDINNEGHIIMHGDARTWKDQLGDVLTLKQQGVGVSTNDTESTVDFATSANLSDYLFSNVQINHDWDIGTLIKPHIHLFQTQNAMPNLLIQYRWQSTSNGKITAWTNYKCNTQAVPYTSGTISQIATGVGITPPAYVGLSDIIQFRVLRDNANTSGVFSGADPYTGVASLLSFDVHIQINTFGSNTEFVK